MSDLKIQISRPWEYVSKSEIFDPVFFQKKTVIQRFFLSIPERPSRPHILQYVVSLKHLDSNQELLRSSIHNCCVVLSEPEPAHLMKLPSAVLMRPDMAVRLTLEHSMDLSNPTLGMAVMSDRNSIPKQLKMHLVGVQFVEET